MPHGLANSIILPYALQQNGVEIREKIEKLCLLLDIENPSFESFLQYILDLRDTLGIPSTLVEAKIPHERVSEVASIAYDDPSTGSNARALKVKDFEALFTACCTGDFGLL